MKSVEFNKEEIDGFIKNNRMKYITISLAIPCFPRNAPNSQESALSWYLPA